MKVFFGVLIVAILAAGGLLFLKSAPAPGSEQVAAGEQATTTDESATAPVGPMVVSEGNYKVDTTASKFDWAGKKPLIEGYVNSGTIDITTGMITVGTSTATGEFTLDLNTLKVGLTAKKPGKETALETHLKSKDFFEVAKYPTSTFKIKKVEAAADSATTFMYTVTGDLTMHGKTNEISFPAKIYSMEGVLHAEAQTEIDRTKWGIVFGSGNFFKGLADNAIADQVAIAFNLVATKQ